MSTFYLDYKNGNDSNSGADWANAWRTITSGATAARIAPGDIIRIAKSPDPVSVGTGAWTDYDLNAKYTQKNIVSSTNATPIVMTITAHGYANGDVVTVQAHNVNTNAQGTWYIANVTANTFELVGSVGNGVGGATGTCRNQKFKAVLLSTAQTKKIDDCETAWTVANTSTISATTTAKQGYVAVSIAKTSPATSTLYGYKAITSTDYSAYQAITFWIQNSAAITAGQWTLTLCSDTAGVTAVDTFAIPAIASTAAWVALTIPRNGGGNLGSAIQSVALKTGATTPATITIILDNITACTTNGLSLTSLISKNSLAQGGTEPWLPIQSINYDGTIVFIDSATSSTAVAGLGYSGTTESVTTYIRYPIATDIVASATQAQTIQDSGTFGNRIAFEGGYNTSSSVQDGETIFSGSNSAGIGLHGNTQAYYSINYLSFVRYTTGFLPSTGIGQVHGVIGDLNGCTTQGLSMGSRPVIFTSIRNICNNSGNGIAFNSPGSLFMSIGNANSNASSAIQATSNGLNRVLSITNANSNGTTAIDFNSNSWGNYVAITNSKYNQRAISVGSNSYGNTIHGLTSSGNSQAGFRNNGTILNLSSCTFSDSTVQDTPSSYLDSRTNCFNYGNTAGDHRIFTDFGSIVTDSTTRHTASDFSWKLAPLSQRNSEYPLTLEIAQVPCNANALVTVKAWVKLDHATNIAASLVCRGGQVAGVTTDVTTSKTADTNWEELTITFTPTEQKVITIHLYAWYVAGNSNAYVDDLTITQA